MTQFNSNKRTQKTAVITGGSRGLGRNTALHLARAGVQVAFTYRSNETEARSLIAEIEKLGGKAVTLQLDASQVKTFDSFVSTLRTRLKETLGVERFDFLINNAGTGVHAQFMDTTEEQFDELMNLHLKGVFFLTQKLVPWMNDGGRILNVSSGLARFSLPGYSAYATMKGGIEVLTRYLAKELGGRKISVNTLAPGAIETDFGGGRVRDDKALNGIVASMTAMGRAGLPDDIGAWVASFMTSESNWMNAQRIEVSGGMFT